MEEGCPEDFFSSPVATVAEPSDVANHPKRIQAFKKSLKEHVASAASASDDMHISFCKEANCGRCKYIRLGDSWRTKTPLLQPQWKLDVSCLEVSMKKLVDQSWLEECFDDDG
eukprot:8395332-Pyramimonas_sp.AAC.1